MGRDFGHAGRSGTDHVLPPFGMAAILNLPGRFKEKSADRAPRHRSHRHLGFAGRAAAFADVATDAGGDDVLPGVRTATAPRDDMVNGQLVASVTAVLTGMTIPLEDVPAGEGHLLVGNAHELAESDDGRQRHIPAKHANVVFKALSLSLENHYSSATPTGDVQRFVGRIQNENVAHASPAVLGHASNVSRTADVVSASHFRS
jgi:hypothetical protein